MPPPRRARRFHLSAKFLCSATITEELPAGGYNPSMYELLKTIDDPSRLRSLERKQLQQLADELRAYVLESVSRTGGHLSSNLGTVELTIALHYVFETPEDRIVWDVGHQTYPHKILTGRRDAMSRLRMIDGISGFPRRIESGYDTFGTAHSSTSISAALGMAVSSRIKNEKRHCIAVIGDGAMSAGMAYEAMNNAGAMNVSLLVILNDNEMSISPPVGALTNYLARLLSGRVYSSARRVSEHLLKRVGVWELARRAEEHMKGMVTPSTLFEEFGFNYIGPIDGHDLDALIPTLTNIKKLKVPQFLHIYWTFLQRGYDQLIHDVAIQHLPVLFALDRAGLVGGDGATHNGAFDFAYLRTVPNLTVMAPADADECRQMLYTGFMSNGPCSVRYPRGAALGEAKKEMKAIPLGKGEVRRTGKRVAILAFGAMLKPALEAAEELDATVANMRFVKPLDLALLREISEKHELIVTLEEHQVMGGAGSAVCEALVSMGFQGKILLLGLPDRFIDHGDPAKLLASVGLDAPGIRNSVRRAMSE